MTPGDFMLALAPGRELTINIDGICFVRVRGIETHPATPVDMVLHCPVCGLQHVDAVEFKPVPLAGQSPIAWGNPPHRSHLCKGCGHVWRPADVATNGVLAVTTKGERDSTIAAPVHFPMGADGVARGRFVGRAARPDEVTPDRRSIGVGEVPS